MEWKSEERKRLIQAILALGTEEEAGRFLRDLMTKKEIREFSRRLRAAEMLAERISYSIISRKTGLSSTTIARVSRWLNSGGGGYRRIIGKLHRHNPAEARRGLS